MKTIGTILLSVLMGWLFVDALRLSGSKISLPYVDHIFPLLVFPGLIIFAIASVVVVAVAFFLKKSKGVAPTKTLLPLKIGALIFVVAISFYVSLQQKVSSQYEKYSDMLIHSTVWSKNFSENNFAKIQPNQSREEVTKLLGEPLREFKLNQETMLVYSDIGPYDSVSKKGYHQRWILMNSNGKVDRIYKQYLTTEQSSPPLARIGL